MSKSGLIGSRLMCRWVFRAVSYALQGTALASSPCGRAYQQVSLVISTYVEGRNLPIIDSKACWDMARVVRCGLSLSVTLEEGTYLSRRFEGFGVPKSFTSTARLFIPLCSDPCVECIARPRCRGPEPLGRCQDLRCDAP